MTPTILHALAAFVAAGAVGLLLGLLGARRAATAACAALVSAGGLLGGIASSNVLRSGEPWRASWDWALPGGGRLLVAVDPLSALFLLPILVIGPLTAIYAHGYLARSDRQVGPHLAFLGGLLASMTVVVIARDLVLFASAWELMTLFTFLLVAFEDHDQEVRHAAFLYVTISHVAALFVLAYLLMVADRAGGSTDLEQIARSGVGSSQLVQGTLLLLALIGFGTKAGLAPLHVWLPRAHPAAPSHVSSLMSGVVVKTALYALLRGTWLLGVPPAWWGYTLLVLGIVTGVGGILFGLAQRDLKRLLAYSTIENMGVIFIGLGVGAIGAAHGHPLVPILAWSGALMHVLHHALMKGLLFAAAGSVVHATHLRSLDRLGGVLRRMPFTGASLVVGSLAIAAVPGLCGFASEFLIYYGLLRAALDLPALPGAFALAGLVGLAAIGALAAASFTKVVGVGLLGAPRSEEAEHAAESPLSMTAPLLLLAAAVVVLGLAPGLTASLAVPVATGLTRTPASASSQLPLQLLGTVGAAASILLLVAALLGAIRYLLLRGRPVSAGRTWGCGYGLPRPSMQYSGSSYSAPLAHVGRVALRAELSYAAPAGYFPAPTLRSSSVPDPAERHLFEAGAARARRRLLSLRWLQQGRLQLYLLYIMIALVALLGWGMVYGGLTG